MATSTAMNSSTDNRALAPQVVAGVSGGIAGGFVFGMMMQMMGMIPMVAMLVGSESTVVGWGLHLAISAIIGAGFGALAGKYVNNMVTALGAGALYGALWWVLGPLVLMPAKLGMPLFQVDSMSLQSLMGHIIFGVVLGAVAAAITRRSVSA